MSDPKPIRKIPKFDARMVKPDGTPTQEFYQWLQQTVEAALRDHETRIAALEP